MDQGDGRNGPSAEEAQAMTASLPGAHAEAVEAALVAAHAAILDGGPDDLRPVMRRAIAAFLQTWDPSAEAHDRVWGYLDDACMLEPMREAARQTAAELLAAPERREG